MIETDNPIEHYTCTMCPFYIGALK